MYHYVRFSQIRSHIYITTECHSNSLSESWLHYQDETTLQSPQSVQSILESPDTNEIHYQIVTSYAPVVKSKQ